MNSSHGKLFWSLLLLVNSSTSLLPYERIALLGFWFAFHDLQFIKPLRYSCMEWCFPWTVMMWFPAHWIALVLWWSWRMFESFSCRYLQDYSFASKQRVLNIWLCMLSLYWNNFLRFLVRFAFSKHWLSVKL